MFFWFDIVEIVQLKQKFIVDMRSYRQCLYECWHNGQWYFTLLQKRFERQRSVFNTINRFQFILPTYHLMLFSFVFKSVSWSILNLTCPTIVSINLAIAAQRKNFSPLDWSCCNCDYHHKDLMYDCLNSCKVGKGGQYDVVFCRPMINLSQKLWHMWKSCFQKRVLS